MLYTEMKKERLVNLRMTDTLVAQIKAAAARADISMSQLIRQAVKEKLETLKN